MCHYPQNIKYYCKYTTLPAPLQECKLAIRSQHCAPPGAMVRLHGHSCHAARAASWRGLLEPNDNQPGGQSSRTVTIPLTRDTLLLIAALAFLAVAILLAVIFPSASSSTPNPSSTGVAQSGTSPPDGRATTAAIAGASTPNTSGPINAEPDAAVGPANYPAPNSEAAQLELSPTPPPTRLPPTPRPPTAIPSPTPIPVDLLRGNIRWTAARSPIRLSRDQELAPGATLTIEPGVEVRLAPGVSFFVEGTLSALGTADRPIRFVANERQRWEGLFGRPGSNIALEYTEIHGGGAGGTLLTSDGGNLVLHHARINDNGGHIQVSDSRLEMRDSEIAGNDMPYGAALDASYLGGGIVIMTNNRIGGNRQQAGSPPVLLNNQSAFETLNLDLQGNLLVGNDAPDLVLFTNGP